MIGAAFGVMLARAQAGDEAAFARLFRDVQPALLRYLRVITPDAEDVAGDTWLQVVTGLGGFRGEEEAFRAWLFTIARHRAAECRPVTGPSSCRAARADRGGPGLAAGQPLAPDAADLALEAISARAVVALIATLPRDQAEIVMLRVVAGLDVADVARIVGQVAGRGPGDRAPRPAAAGRPPGAGGCNAMSVPDASHGEMPGFPFPGRPGGEHDEPLLDMIFDGRVIPPDAPQEMHDLQRMLAALAGPAEPGELAGEAAARAAFIRLASPVGVSPAASRPPAQQGTRRPASHRVSRGRRARRAGRRAGLAAALCAAAAVLASTAAAYAGVLPEPIQQMAHAAVGAPAPRQHGSPAQAGAGSRHDTRHAPGPASHPAPRPGQVAAAGSAEHARVPPPAHRPSVRPWSAATCTPKPWLHEGPWGIPTAWPPPSLRPFPFYCSQDPGKLPG